MALILGNFLVVLALSELMTSVRGYENSPFNVYWNVPTERCQHEYGVPLTDLLATFGLIVNAGGDGWRGKNITIFYSDELGLYPYIADNGTVVNGGVPQAVNMTAHLVQAEADIKKYIPDENFAGLGVIDWEDWRPLWDRNWDAKQVYKQLSEKLVRNQHPSWTPQQVTQEAQQQFEKASRHMMQATVQLAQKLRPRGKWGYYLFPECYNYDGSRYCTNKTRTLNDKISWLFNISTGLYPSAYLNENINTSHQADFVFGQVEEARRVRAGNVDLPVFLYSRFTYSKNHSQYYSLTDIYASVAQAAVLGTDGVVIWDDHVMESSPDVCRKVFNFIQNFMGPCVVTSLDFTKQCSKYMCNAHGRCALNKDYNDISSLWRTDAPTYRHLTQLMSHYIGEKSTDFMCECYSGWAGKSCDIPGVKTF